MTKQVVDPATAKEAEANESKNSLAVANGKETMLSDEDFIGATVHREHWGKKIDFLLSVIGFAVDLGNVWRFPYICYANGGGAFLLPYAVMLVFGGLPLFYLELALGQYQRCGCITVWRRICPAFKGIGFAICVIASYVAFYYNTIIAWSLYYLVHSFRREVPWKTCNNTWNTDNCTLFDDFVQNTSLSNNSYRTTATQEFFNRAVLEVQKSHGIENVGPIKWSIALCLLAVFVIVYFSIWKGVKSSGKAVWVTATLPYAILLILLIRGVTLTGAMEGIKYYLSPQWDRLLDTSVWIAAAQQVFFSLGPGFGVLLALSSYNTFNNNCYSDALLTAAINSMTSFLAGFVVFSVLGYMSVMQKKPIETVATEGPGLVFVVYPEAIAQLPGSVFWAIIFFLMLITLGLDSTYGGLESVITGICDEWPNMIGKRREMFVAGLIVYCFLGGLCTTTYGGSYIVTLLDSHGPPYALLFICFLEAIAVSWFYGFNRFCTDIESMLGFQPGMFWKVCWVGISPVFLLFLFVMSIYEYKPLEQDGYEYPDWITPVGWCIIMSSIVCVPIFMVYKFFTTKGTVLERIRTMFTPEEIPPNPETAEIAVNPTFV